MRQLSFGESLAFSASSLFWSSHSSSVSWHNHVEGPPVSFTIAEENRMIATHHSVTPCKLARTPQFPQDMISTYTPSFHTLIYLMGFRIIRSAFFVRWSIDNGLGRYSLVGWGWKFCLLAAFRLIDRKFESQVVLGTHVNWQAWDFTTLTCSGQRLSTLVGGSIIGQCMNMLHGCTGLLRRDSAMHLLCDAFKKPQA